ncbi:MAG: NAD(P)/FAD-dependent oxidoreductase [Candidatus Altiarchaeota archaeon]|nr:NAD(P)/FAD-dependent oxidoreductase [Candidatus Altiarchaeota archaeon]
MKDLDYDVVIVGAGPAGSITARRLAENGVKVIVLEKKQEIGTPKRCAEGLNIVGLKSAGIEPNPLWAVNEINGAILYSPAGRKVAIKNDKYLGYILERKIFEKHLAAQAIDKGARYMVKTRVMSVIMENGSVVGVSAEHMGESFNVRAKIVIAADGVDSKIGRSAGLNTVNRMTDYHSGFQYEMAGVKCEGNMLHIFFGDSVAPKGYVWIFPKGHGIANVGIGVLSLVSDDGNRARDHLDRFIANHPQIFAGASPIEINAGGIPVSSSCETFVGNGIMLVGDAAQQVNPIHGGGISLAMDAAIMAAEVAVKALREGTYAKERLFEYERRWRETEGARMKKLYDLRGFLEKLEDEDFERLAGVINDDVIMAMTSGEFTGFLKVLVKIPKLFPVARKMLM